MIQWRKNKYDYDKHNKQEFEKVEMTQQYI